MSVEPDPAGPSPEAHPELEVAHLELDESVPPRPEEEIADVLRSAPQGRP